MVDFLISKYGHETLSVLLHHHPIVQNWSFKVGNRCAKLTKNFRLELESMAVMLVT